MLLGHGQKENRETKEDELHQHQIAEKVDSLNRNLTEY